MEKRKEPVQDDVSRKGRWNMKHSDGGTDTCDVALTSTVRDK